MASNFNADSADAGSLRYMAPEILTGSSKVTPLVDVWAMGVILYGMLFGALPFLGNTNKDVI
jgi:MAP/microtubule affinity-regulating kinase